MILCLGPTPAVQRSMSFDRVVLDDVNRTADVRQYASGKSVNAARVLKTLGVAVICTGFVGGDSGQFLTTDLSAAGIENDFVTVGAGTRTCLTLIDRAAKSATELIEESRPLDPTDYTALLEKFAALLPRASAVLLSGSLPPGAPVDFYRRCVEIAGDKNVMLDAAGEPLRVALPARPMVVKPNRSELAKTVGLPVETDAQLKTAITALLADGPQYAVVTHGKGITVCGDGKQFWKISTPTVSVVSAIGSGDSFAAGLMAGMFAGQTVPDACRQAAACGAANAMTADAGFLDPEEVHRLTNLITVEPF